MEHGTRLRPSEPACRVRGDCSLARRGAGSGASAGARFRRRAARPLGSHGRGADGAYPSWLEVRLRTETELMGRFVGRVGSARYVSEIDYVAGRVTFRVPVQYERGTDELRFEGTLRGDRIEGTTLVENGATVRFTAMRAPALARTRRPRWRAAMPLVNGRDLTGWTPRSARARRLLARARRRAVGDAAVRRPRDGRDVPRLSLARGAQVSARQQQRRVPARPLRGADPRRRRQGARPAADGRRLRLHRAERRRGARPPASGRRSTSSSSAGASPSC